MKSLIKRAIHKTGFEIHRLTPEVKDAEYQLIHPQATFSPWNADAAFKIIYRQIKQHTLVDEYRCYELWHLVQQVSKLKHGNFLEVGVWRGGTGALIATQ